MRPTLGYSFALGLMVFGQSPAFGAEPTSPVVAVFEISDERPKRQRLSDSKRAALTDFLRSQLAAGGKFQVVPPGEVQQALRANKADSYKACYDEACQIEVGKELAAEKSLATKIARIGSQCVITSTLYDLARATTESSAPHRGKCKDDDLLAGLERIATVLRGGKVVTTQGFARARVELGELAPMKDFRVDTQGASFAGLDVTYLKLVQAAKRLEKRKKADPAACNKAWQKVAQYKGKNPLADSAKARAEYWKKAEALFTRYSADKTKLDELMKLDDDVLPRSQKAIAEVEFQSAYVAYAEALARLGLKFPWAQLSNGTFCPSGAKVVKKTSARKTGSGKKRVMVTTKTEACERAGKRQGLTIETRSTGERYEKLYQDAKLDGRWLKFIDGKKREEHFYKSGKKHGVVRTWRSDGSLALTKDRYVQGKLQGLSEYRASNGQLERRTPYVAGKKHGLEERWHKTGELRERTPYLNGKMHGERVGFRGDGSLAWQLDYVMGKRKGEERTFHTNGAKQWVYKTNDGHREGPATRWYSTGELAERRSYVKGKAQGSFNIFRADGTKRRSGAYRAGKLDGEVFDWFPTGTRSSKATYHAGKWQGPRTRWSGTGHVTFKGSYKADKKEGLAEEFFEGGEKRSKKSYQAGKAHGLTTVWRRSGKIQSSGKMAQGKKDGVWRYYRQHGPLEREVTYVKGKRQGTARYWHTNGKLHREIEYKAGRLHGTRSVFDRTGKLLGKTTFIDGAGEFRDYYDNGMVKQQGGYVAGQRSGVWTSYYRGGRRSSVETYDAGKVVKRIRYRASGPIMKEESFGKGGRQGRFAVYDVAGKVVHESTFEGGTGDYASVDAYGRIYQRGQYVKGQPEGAWTSFDFVTKRPTQELPYQNGRYHGTRIDYFKSGAKKRTMDYVNNRSTGVYEQLHEAGSPQVQGQYENGYRTGQWSFLAEDGQVPDRQTFKGGTGTWMVFEGGKRVRSLGETAGMGHGVEKRWHANGQLFSEATWVLGKRHGPSRGYYDDGKKMWVGQSESGNRSGVWTYWDRSGTQIAQTDYSADRYTHIELKPSGARRNERAKYFDMRDGPSRSWNSDTGYPSYESEYSLGERLSYKSYHSDTGRLRSEGRSAPGGRRVGMWSVYDPKGQLLCQADYSKACPEFSFVDAAKKPHPAPRIDLSASKDILKCHLLAEHALGYCPAR